MNIKIVSLLFTILLLLFGAYYIIEIYRVCNQCNPTFSTQPDTFFAAVNFMFAIFSGYLITKKKFSASAIVSAIIAGLQLVIVGMVLFNF